LVDFHQPIDIRHIATLVDQSDKALFFHKVIGYEMPVVSGPYPHPRAHHDGDGRDRIPRDRGAAEEMARQPDSA
jgi:3-polyprenyl-4-hydroxybenzoate decarboxylase